MCDMLVGGVIDVPVTKANCVYLKPAGVLWSAYDEDVLRLDDHLLYCNIRDLTAMGEYTSKTVKERLKISGTWHTTDQQVWLDYIREVKEQVTVEDQQTTQTTPEPNVQAWLEQIHDDIPHEWLMDQLTRRYNLSDSTATAYIEEYKKFMALIKFNDHP
jgi:hypothetical protein